METKRTICALALVILLILPSVAAYGQISFGQPASGSTGVVFTSWKLTPDIGPEAKITQLWIPMDGYVPLKDNLEARVYLANGSTNLDVAGTELDISGLSNLNIQFSQSLNDDQWLISAGIGLPAGKKKLSLSAEKAVLEALAQSFLDFPMRRYGEGFGFNLLVGTARQMGEIMLSGGAMYQYLGSYEPYEGVDEYDPGNNLNINAAAETKRDLITWTASAIFASYQADQNAGQKVFKQGNHLNLILGGRWSGERSAYGGQIRYMIRARNSWYEAATETVIQRLKLYGNEFELSVDAAFKLNPSWQLRPMASLRLIEENELGIGNSHLFTFGASAATNLGDQFGLELGIKYLSGQAGDGLIDVDLSGLQITTGLTASF
ncbi:MAG: hypothetical protein DRP45_02280 [Candidatus Zixiibacteriota bacterium]|nr:MAG: hypothetical protein DRP45_02280 [candidate division Zixibacteria bacterium]